MTPPTARPNSRPITWIMPTKVKWTKRFSHGVSGGIAYTWAKMLDYGSGQQGVEAAVGESVLFPQVRFLDKGVGGLSGPEGAGLKGFRAETPALEARKAPLRPCVAEALQR